MSKEVMSEESVLIICLLILIIMFWGEPDLCDAIIQNLMRGE